MQFPKTIFQVSKEVKKQVIKKFSPASVEIAIIEEGINDGSESSNYTAKVEANIICPVCQKKTKAHKLEYGKQGKMRWVVSNFERHFKSHFSNAGSGGQIHSSNHPTGKTKQVSLEKFVLQSSSENQLEDDGPINEFQEEYPNRQDENDIGLRIVTGTKYSTMDSAGISEGSSETASSGE